MDCTHDNLVKLFWNGENEKKERLKINEEGIKYAFFMALKDFTPRTEKREESVSFAAKDMLEELEKSDTHIELEPYSKMKKKKMRKNLMIGMKRFAKIF